MVDAEIEGERVLYDHQRWTAARLDPVGSLIWTVLDGAGTVGDLAVDVAEAFSIHPQEALTAVLALLEQLDAEGFLDDGTPASAPAEVERVPRSAHLVDPPSP